MRGKKRHATEADACAGEEVASPRDDKRPRGPDSENKQQTQPEDQQTEEDNENVLPWPYLRGHFFLREQDNHEKKLRCLCLLCARWLTAYRYRNRDGTVRHLNNFGLVNHLRNCHKETLNSLGITHQPRPYKSSTRGGSKDAARDCSKVASPQSQTPPGLSSQLGENFLPWPGLRRFFFLSREDANGRTLSCRCLLCPEEENTPVKIETRKSSFLTLKFHLLEKHGDVLTRALKLSRASRNRRKSPTWCKLPWPELRDCFVVHKWLKGGQDPKSPKGKVLCWCLKCRVNTLLSQALVNGAYELNRHIQSAHNLKRCTTTLDLPESIPWDSESGSEDEKEKDFFSLLAAAEEDSDSQSGVAAEEQESPEPKAHALSTPSAPKKSSKAPRKRASSSSEGQTRVGRPPTARKKTAILQTKKRPNSSSPKSKLQKPRSRGKQTPVVTTPVCISAAAAQDLAIKKVLEHFTVSRIVPDDPSWGLEGECRVCKERPYMAHATDIVQLTAHMQSKHGWDFGQKTTSGIEELVRPRAAPKVSKVPTAATTGPLTAAAVEFEVIYLDIPVEDSGSAGVEGRVDFKPVAPEDVKVHNHAVKAAVDTEAEEDSETPLDSTALKMEVDSTLQSSEEILNTANSEESSSFYEEDFAFDELGGGDAADGECSEAGNHDQEESVGYELEEGEIWGPVRGELEEGEILGLEPGEMEEGEILRQVHGEVGEGEIWGLKRGEVEEGELLGLEPGEVKEGEILGLERGDDKEEEVADFHESTNHQSYEGAKSDSPPNHDSERESKDSTPCSATWTEEKSPSPLKVYSKRQQELLEPPEFTACYEPKFTDSDYSETESTTDCEQKTTDSPQKSTDREKKTKDSAQESIDCEKNFTDSETESADCKQESSHSESESPPRASPQPESSHPKPESSHPVPESSHFQMETSQSEPESPSRASPQPASVNQPDPSSDLSQETLHSTGCGNEATRETSGEVQEMMQLEDTQDAAQNGAMFVELEVDQATSPGIQTEKSPSPATPMASTTPITQCEIDLSTPVQMEKVLLTPAPLIPSTTGVVTSEREITASPVVQMEENPTPAPQLASAAPPLITEREITTSPGVQTEMVHTHAPQLASAAPPLITEREITTSPGVQTEMVHTHAPQLFSAAPPLITEREIDLTTPPVPTEMGPSPALAIGPVLTSECEITTPPAVQTEKSPSPALLMATTAPVLLAEREIDVTTSSAVQMENNSTPALLPPRTTPQITERDIIAHLATFPVQTEKSPSPVLLMASTAPQIIELDIDLITSPGVQVGRNPTPTPPQATRAPMLVDLTEEDELPPQDNPIPYPAGTREPPIHLNAEQGQALNRGAQPTLGGPPTSAHQGTALATGPPISAFQETAAAPLQAPPMRSTYPPVSLPAMPTLVTGPSTSAHQGTAAATLQAPPMRATEVHSRSSVSTATSDNPPIGPSTSQSTPVHPIKSQSPQEHSISMKPKLETIVQPSASSWFKIPADLPRMKFNTGNPSARRQSVATSSRQVGQGPAPVRSMDFLPAPMLGMGPLTPVHQGTAAGPLHPPPMRTVDPPLPRLSTVPNLGGPPTSTYQGAAPLHPSLTKVCDPSFLETPFNDPSKVKRRAASQAHSMQYTAGSHMHLSLTSTFTSSGQTVTSQRSVEDTGTGSNMLRPLTSTFTSSGQTVTSQRSIEYTGTGSNMLRPLTSTFTSSGHTLTSQRSIEYTGTGSNVHPPLTSTFTSSGQTVTSQRSIEYTGTGSNMLRPLTSTFTSSGQTVTSQRSIEYTGTGSNMLRPLTSTFTSSGQTVTSQRSIEYTGTAGSNIHLPLASTFIAGQNHTVTSQHLQGPIFQAPSPVLPPSQLTPPYQAPPILSSMSNMSMPAVVSSNGPVNITQNSYFYLQQPQVQVQVTPQVASVPPTHPQTQGLTHPSNSYPGASYMWVPNHQPPPPPPATYFPTPTYTPAYQQSPNTWGYPQCHPLPTPSQGYQPPH